MSNGSAFRTELRVLLSKYNAELTAEGGEDVRMTVSIPTFWNYNGETLHKRVEIDLGRFQNGTTKDLTTE